MHLYFQNLVEPYKAMTKDLLVLFIPALSRAKWLLEAKIPFKLGAYGPILAV